MKLKAVSLTIIIMMCIVYSCTVFAASDSNISFSTTNVTLITTGEKSADLVDFVNKAKTYAIENGKDKALAVFNDRNGPFTKGDLYIFAYDYDGYTLALPYLPNLLGSNRLSLLDSSLFRSVQAIRDLAAAGGGFIQYNSQNPGNNFKEEGKVSYVADVDGSWFLGAGRYLNTTLKKPEEATNAEAEKNLDIIIRNSTSQLKSIDASLKNTADLLSKTGLSGPGAETALEKLRESNPYAIDSMTIAMNGTIMAVQPLQYSSIIGKNIGGQDHIKKLFTTTEPQMSDIIKTVEGIDEMVVAYPVFNQNGEIIGATGFVINHDLLFKDLFNSTESNSIQATVMQKDGTIIYESNEEETGKNVLPDSSFNDFPSLKNLIKRVMVEQSGSGTYTYIRDISKEQENLSTKRDDIVSKVAAWNTLGFYGNYWKIMIDKIIQ